MKKLFLLLATIYTLTAKAQTSVYFPFPDSAIIWRQESFTQGFSCCCSGSGPCLRENDFQYFLAGDTLIGTIVYKKIFQTGNGVQHIVGPSICPPWCISNGEYYYYNNLYAGAIRQDTVQRKIFFMPPDFTQDTLLYDFNLNVGDTLPNSWTNYYPSNYVSIIDSVLIGSHYRKRFWLTHTIGSNYISLIEGIGSTYGLLSPLLPNWNVSFIYNMLICLTLNNATVYPDTSTICNLISKINDVESNSSFALFPNPFSEKLNIKLNGNLISEITLYDIASRKILQQEFTNSISISTAQLSKGLYLYELRNKDGSCKKGIVVKD